jgi:putative ABC transport system ATP-binding protein
MKPLVVENITKTYRQGGNIIPALNQVSLSVSPGQFLAIMGASGSGKSTLLHVMAGLTAPDSGRILINENDLTKMGDRALTLFRRRHIGLVFQAFNLVPTLSARDNVGLPLLLDGVAAAEIRRKADQLLSTLGLASRASHRPDVLSGGEQQRVAIGRALINNPAVILADEPTGNLDSASSRGVCELLRDLSAIHGKTVVLVTHEPSVAAYSQAVVVMKDGRLIDRFDTRDTPGSQELALRYQECLREAAESGCDR